MNSRFNKLIEQSYKTQEILGLDHLELPAFSDLGGYDLFYLDNDNCTLCWKCATKEILEYLKAEEDGVKVVKNPTSLTFSSKNTSKIIELINKLSINSIGFACSFVFLPVSSGIVSVPINIGTEVDKSYIQSLPYDYEPDPFPLANYDINWEDENMYCEQCNTKIPSAYGGEETQWSKRDS